LGGYRSGGYEAYTESETFAEGLRRLEEVAATRQVAVACSERLPWKCHRRFIGRALVQRGWEVRHIIDIEREWVPR
ncbi:MAG: DUF488 family protein, partial [Anaerolineae bacterium]